MVTVSLQPFAFRKIVVLIAALIWLTSAVLFADPVFMNAHAAGAAHSADRNGFRGYAATQAASVNAHRRSSAVAAEAATAPGEGPAMLSLSLERLDTWNAVAPRPFTRDAELTFWSMSLTR